MTILGRHAEDFCLFAFGEKLGEGINRAVYACQFDRTKVIKYQARNSASPSYANLNVLEWEAWGWTLDHRNDLRKWLAPCHFISDCGRFLIQDKVRILHEHERPKKLPEFLTDFQTRNFGRLPNGRIVACDYGTIMGRVFRERAPVRLKKVFWTA